MNTSDKECNEIRLRNDACPDMNRVLSPCELENLLDDRDELTRLRAEVRAEINHLRNRQKFYPLGMADRMESWLNDTANQERGE